MNQNVFRCFPVHSGFRLSLSVTVRLSQTSRQEVEKNGIVRTQLTSKDKAQAINQAEMAKLKTQAKTFTQIRTGSDRFVSSVPGETIVLKKDCQARKTFLSFSREMSLCLKHFSPKGCIGV